MRVRPRSQLQAVFSTQPGSFFLINASPDLRSQIEADPDLHPMLSQHARRNTPIRGIILTGAELDQVLGLLLLREFQPLTIYATVAVREALEANSFFHMLMRVPNQLSWVEIAPNSPFVVGDSAVCTPIALGEHQPYYLQKDAMGKTGRPRLVSLGLLLESERSRIAYTPSLAQVTPELCALYKSCDAICVDGTFWSEHELSQTQLGAPLAQEIGHLAMSGTDGSIARLAAVSHPQKIFVHINNTNPVLDQESAEYRSVCEAGWQIGYDGWRLTL